MCVACLRQLEGAIHLSPSCFQPYCLQLLRTLLVHTARALTVISPRCKLTISEGSSEENEGANESGLESAGTLSSVSALVIHREFRKRMLCCFHVCLYLPVIPSRGRGEGRNNDLFCSESKLDFALQDREHLFEIMAMRRRAAAGWNVHVDETVATGRVFAGHENCVLSPANPT